MEMYNLFQTGTLAGNLSIKHAHNEFPSDIFIILEGCGAKLIIADSVDLRTEVTPFEYLSLEMNKKCILKVVFPQLGTGYKFRSYKVFLEYAFNLFLNPYKQNITLCADNDSSSKR